MNLPICQLVFKAKNLINIFANLMCVTANDDMSLIRIASL